MAYVPGFIKPSRECDEIQILTKERVFKNNLVGIETSVILDLNVLNAMKNVMLRKVTLDESGLGDLVAFFNSNPVYIVPGFALSEADEFYIASIINIYESFIERYCPSYIDTPNCLNNDSDRKRSRKFVELEEADRNFLAISYVSMLTIHVIDKENTHLTPEGKFEAYVTYMDKDVDFLAAIEAEIAKFWFYNRKLLPDCEFKKSCKVIRDNFNKGGKGEGRLTYILNSARDLMYYRVTALKDGKYIEGGGIQDTWLVTGDKALTELSKYLYFFPSEGSSSKMVCYSTIPEKEASPYWNYCDELFIKIVSSRLGKTKDKDFTKDNFSKILSSITDLENKIRKYWPE